MEPARADHDRAMTTNLLGIALSLAILVVGVFLGLKLAGALQVEDCDSAAVPSCQPVAMSWEPRPVERQGGWHDMTGASRR